ncbi:hybrid sensor histidine kinase/response regulator [Croceicoccus naphthovorans]|uniref:histidine kinase n=1 Tax=Croceicoccus naphthovorans TaxID=1348774 RepID=A0A0G3XFP5_9SPHN|nr:hybrid sensor histidine kinase/response regulator [Croceicoccus naphthovorans]AKM09439.1 histidine kinase [Croceicoccus naphthovorans]MBB3991950.1 signal transduction histidine kinase [Croceicoccus naphthovorans]
MTAPEAPINFLLVDDLPENLLALEALLRRDGVQFHTAQSGEEALELMLEHDYALALLDVQMPGMDGFELAEIMRANERSRHIPIIFVTAGTGDISRRFRGYEAGAVDFIQKPIEADILRSKAEVFLGLYAQRRQIAAQRDELAILTSALQAADKQKNHFLAVLGHELRNPLSVLSSGLNILERGNTRIDAEGVRTAMRQNLSHVSRLVEDLLDIARIEQGKISLRKEPITLQEVLPLALELNRPAIDEAGHELKVSVPDDPIELDGDPARIIQIISNLVGNAARYTPAGGQISVSLAAADGQAVLEVSDTGVGIDVEEQEKIFELFGQAASVSGKVTGGLGIGLALVKELVELHGGTISLKSSAKGMGSCFQVRLPTT